MKLIFINILLIFSFAVFAEEYAVVQKVNGIVLSAGKTLSIGDKIKVGQIIDASAKGSFIDLTIPGEGKMRLVGGLMKVKKIEMKDSLYELLKGKIFTFFRSGKNEEKNLRIHTNEGSFAVRGTKFAVIKEKDYKSLICVCEGSVEVKNNYGVSGIVHENEEVEFSGVDRNIASKISSGDMTKLRGMFKKMGL